MSKKAYNFSCVVPCCGYRQPSKSATGSSQRRVMFVFTKNRDLAKKWIDQIEGLKDKSIKRSAKICEAHFEPGYIERKKTRVTLVPKAMPTLNVRSQGNTNSRNQENKNPNARSQKVTNPGAISTSRSRSSKRLEPTENPNAVPTSRSRSKTNTHAKIQENANPDALSNQTTNPDSAPKSQQNGNSTTVPSTKRPEIMNPQVLRKNNITAAAAQHLQPAVVRLDKNLPAQKTTPDSVIEFIDLTEDSTVDDKSRIFRLQEPKSDPDWRHIPLEPQLKISRLEKGIRLIWNMNLSDNIAEIGWYELYACKVGTPADVVARWKKIGEVQAFTLPMSCDLLGQAFTEGKNCLFAIRAVDVHTRCGPYSNTCVL